ncbi:MAG: hypothetical protein ACE15C_02935 [Phycisphaerae bacterium]
MVRLLAIVAAFSTTLAVAACGCSKDSKQAPAPSSAPLVGAASPKEALLNIATAFETGDKRLFLASVYVTDPEWAGAAFDASIVAAGLRELLETAYGQQEASSLDAFMVSFPSRDEVEAKVTIVENGDLAGAGMLGSLDIQLVRKDGRWLVELADQQPKPDERDESLDMLRRFVQVAPGFRDKIGREGYTALKIEEDLMSAMLPATTVESGTQPK